LAKQTKRKQQLEAPEPEMLKQAIGKLSVKSLSGIRCEGKILEGPGACLSVALRVARESGKRTLETQGPEIIKRGIGEASVKSFLRRGRGN